MAVQVYDLSGNQIKMDAVVLQSKTQPNTGPTIIFGAVGAGPPTVSATKGSLFINTTAAAVGTRLYINTTGSTTWASFTASA